MNIVLLAVGCILILYAVGVDLTVGYIAFHTVIAAFGVFLILLVPIRKRLGQTRKGRRFSKIISFCLGALVLVLAVSEGFVISGAFSQGAQSPDYTIILGAGLRGRELSDTLKRRLDEAVSQDKGEIFVVTGGQGIGEALPEGEAMAAYLLERGIPRERILIENTSTSTWENLVNAGPLIQKSSQAELDALTIQIVTSEFHCYRARLIARRAGYGEVFTLGAKTDPWIAPGCYLREAAALIKTAVFDR